MSDLREIGLVTTASVTDVAGYIVADAVAYPDQGRLTVESEFLEETGLFYSVSSSIPGAWHWPNLGRKPTMIAVFDSHRSYKPEAVRVDLEVATLIGIMKREDVEIGEFRDLDIETYVWWDERNVVVNSEPSEWGELLVAGIKRRLTDEGIAYRREPLEI